MPTSLKELVSVMEQLGYSHTVRSDGADPVITTAFGTSNYRDADGDPGVQLVIQLLEGGEYLHIFAPKAFNLSDCRNRSAALEAFAGIQRRHKLVRFEYDADDGEVRPDVGCALEDAALTERQFHRLLAIIPGMLDTWHTCIARAMETGVVDFEMPAEDSGSRGVSFDRLAEFTELGEGAAAIIGQCRTDLDLSGLESITAADVRALSQSPWCGTESSSSTFDLDLSGLKTLPLDVAEALACRFDGLPAFMHSASLRLDGIESLTAEVARAIAGYSGDLSLNGLATIDADVAAALAIHRADLNLDGVSELGVDAAQAIMGHTGNISFDGLTELEDAVAAHLLAVPEAKTTEADGDEDDDGGDNWRSRRISLGGLERLTSVVADLFVRHATAKGNDIWLNEVRSIDAATATVLGRHNRDLILNGLTELDETTAAELARSQGHIRLRGLKALSAEVAKALATHEGDLSLDSVGCLSDAAAEALAAHKGFLDLSGILELSPVAAQRLVKHVGKLLIPLDNLEADVRDILREHPSLFTVEPDVPARLPTAIHAELRSARIAAAHVAYDGADDSGSFGPITLRLSDGRTFDECWGAEEIADVLLQADILAANDSVAAHSIATTIYQLLWAAVPSGWEINEGSSGEVAVDVTAGTITLSHAWREESEEQREFGEQLESTRRMWQKAGMLTSEDEGEEEAETQSSEVRWGDTTNQDELIAADVAELADSLRRGVSRKDWLDAHADHVPLWEQAAERGTPQGLMILGLCHWFGIGREEDHDAARPFFEQAANKGEPQAQFSLGQLFLNKAREGEGTETERDAYRWFLASAESGVAQAQFEVAELLWTGEGIGRDERAGVEWMKRSAAQGHGQAAFTLAELHLTNRPSAGIKKNREKAIEWGRIAAAAGHEGAREWLAKHEHGVVMTADIAGQILEHWRENSDRHGPRTRRVSMSIGGDDTEDDDSLPPPSGPFADPPGTIVNSLGMKLVPIPAGEFLMGSSAECPLGDSDEEFQHRVRITKPFMLGMHQVTQAQYQEVAGENPSLFKGPDLPVEHLTWKQAQQFCELLSGLPAEVQAGRRYRLPTEAEWEYACRAGSTTPFHTGDSLEPDQARFAFVSRSSPKQTAPVGTYPPNAWGLHDMHGNVWEWTSDWFSADYFRESPLDDPQGPATGTHHTLRGGSASVESHECRATIRGEADPADGPDATGQRYQRYGDFGLRVVFEGLPSRTDGGEETVGTRKADAKVEAVRIVSREFQERLKEVVDAIMAHLRDDNAKEILGVGLSPMIGRGPLKAIVTFALYSDVLRVVRDVMAADGDMSDEELGAGFDLLSLLAAGFAKVRRDYASFARLTPESSREFLEKYAADGGWFGHANKTAMWAGVGVCRNVTKQFNDSRPYAIFGKALVSWAERIAGTDNVLPQERAVIDALRKTVGL